MSGKRPSYEDFFRIPNAGADQSVDSLQSGSNLRQAAEILVGRAMSIVLAGDPRAQPVMSDIQYNQGLRFPQQMQNEQRNWNPQFDERRHLGSEPERLRPLETSERYEQEHRNLSENREQSWEQGLHRDRENFTREGRLENRMYSRGGEEEYDRQPMYNREREEEYGRQSMHNRGAEEYDRQPVHNRGREEGYDRQPMYKGVGEEGYGRQPVYNRGGEEGYDRQPYGRQALRYGQPEPMERSPYNDRQREFYTENYDSHQEFAGNKSVSETERQYTEYSVNEQQQKTCGSSNASGPRKDEEDSKDESKDDDEEEDTLYCKLCDVRFENPQKYFTHTRGMLHTQRQMAMESSGEGQADEKKDQPEPDTQQQENQTPCKMDQGDKGQENEEDEDDDDDDTSFCKLCNVHFDDAQKYYRHTRGMLHTQRQMEGDKTRLGLMEEEGQQQQQERHKQQAEDQQLEHPAGHAPTRDEPKESEAEVNEYEDEDEEFWEAEQDKNSNEFVCELCDVRTTGVQALYAHKNGRSHKTVQEAVDNGTCVPQRIFSKLGPKAQIPERLKPATAAVLSMKPADGPSMLMDLLKSVSEAVVGTEHVKEGRSMKQPTFLCTTCECMCDLAGIVPHLLGAKHRMKYLRAYRPGVYEHVRSHGGKKSQLSVFLEEVCTDIEKKEGRKEPIMERPIRGTDDEKEPEKSEPAESEKNKNASNDKKPALQARKLNPDTGPQKGKKKADRAQFGRRHLPHDVIMARYKEDRERQETFGPGGPYGPRPWDEPFSFGEGPVRGPSREQYYDFRRGPEPYSPFVNYPDPHMSEEERLHRMYEYESYLFNHPMLLVSPEEARHLMFTEYEKLGIPYDVACERVLVQEDRRMKLMEYVKEGVSVKEAQARMKRIETRKQKIREYEQQGLEPREARWKVIVEEERSKLLEKYEQLGFTLLEARAKIMAGEDRMHLIQEFERHGMTPEEAYRRAVKEEDRMKNAEAPGRSSGVELSLDDVADRKMIETCMEQGDTREKAENKLIAILRRQGVPTQEAILRAQRIVVTVPEKLSVRSPVRTYDDHKKDRDEERKTSSRVPQDLDNITPEEAKERLFKEYEKRGVPREKARLALIQELISAGVPEEEARQRFSDVKPAEGASREAKEKRKKDSGYERCRSRSPSPSSSRKRRRSSSVDRKKYSEGRQDRHRLAEENRREEKSMYRSEKDYDRRARGSKERERKREPETRPTLTLGEELKLKAKKLKRAEFLNRLEEGSVSAKQTKPDATQSSAEKAEPAPKRDEKSVSDLLESLTDSLISSEDNESAAMSMSKALTSALLKYRLKGSGDEKEKSSVKMASNSFVERRIQDAKKLFETKMVPSKDQPGPSSSGMSHERYGGNPVHRWKPSLSGAEKHGMPSGRGSKDAPRTVRPESFGLPPPLPQKSSAQGSFPSGSSPSQSRVQSLPSQERKPIIPRVLMAQTNLSKGSSSSANRYRR